MAEEQRSEVSIEQSDEQTFSVVPLLDKVDQPAIDEDASVSQPTNTEAPLPDPMDTVAEPEYRSPPQSVGNDAAEPMETSAADDTEQQPAVETATLENPGVESDGQGLVEPIGADLGNEDASVNTESSGALQPESSVTADAEEPTPVETDIGRIKINIKTQDEIKVVSVGPDATVAELKLAVGSNLKLSVDRICLIYSGKMLLDEETLGMHSIADDSTVYLITRPSQPQTSESGSQSFAYGPAQFSTLSTSPINFTQLQQQLQKQMLNNPDLVRQLVDNPLVQQLMSNPDVMKEMMMSVPQSRELLERNPEISDLLNNPEIMKQTFELARDPASLESLLSQADQGSGVNSTDSSALGGAQSGWSFPGFSLGSNCTVPESTTLLQQLAGNPQVVQQMLQAPYMSTVMEGLAKNPQWAQQMITQNPLFSGNPHLQQQMSVLMPHYIQQMQNPEMQSLMTNPKALQAMLRIQQGMNVLQSEAPNLATSMGLPYLSVPPTPAYFAAMHPTPAAGGDAGRGSVLGSQYDPFSIMMSQIVQQTANRQLSRPHELRYEQQLDRLSSMGFSDREMNLQVLIGTFGDVTAAVDQLMRQQNN